MRRRVGRGDDGEVGLDQGHVQVAVFPADGEQGATGPGGHRDGAGVNRRPHSGATIAAGRLDGPVIHRRLEPFDSKDLPVPGLDLLGGGRWRRSGCVGLNHVLLRRAAELVDQYVAVGTQDKLRAAAIHVQADVHTDDGKHHRHTPVVRSTTGVGAEFAKGDLEAAGKVKGRELDDAKIGDVALRDLEGGVDAAGKVKVVIVR